MALSAPSRRRPGAWGRTSGFLSVDSVDVPEIRSQLKDLKRSITKEQRRANRSVAKQVETWSRSEARAAGGLAKLSAGAIKARGDAKRARLRIVPGVRTPAAQIAFWGARKRTGWYARYRYRNTRTPQHRDWVGASWRTGVRGEGPYVLNDVLADRRDDIGRIYLEAHEQVVGKALEGRQQP